MAKRDDKRWELAVRLGVADVSDILTFAEAGAIIQEATGMSARAFEEQREGKTNAARPRFYKTTTAPTGGLIFHNRIDIDGYIARLNGDRRAKYPQGLAEWPPPSENKPLNFATFQIEVDQWRLKERRLRYNRSLNDPAATYEEAFQPEWNAFMDASIGHKPERDRVRVRRLTFALAAVGQPGILNLSHPALPTAQEIVRSVWHGLLNAEKGWRGGVLDELPG